MSGATTGSAGGKTLLRGLDIIEALIDGPITIADLALKLGLPRSTTHRLVSALTDRRYISRPAGPCCQLGPKLLALGFSALQQTDLVQVARPILEQLAAATQETAHLAVVDAGRALYLGKVAGRRRVKISSRVGDYQPLARTGIGKALLLDEDSAAWRAQYDTDRLTGPDILPYHLWAERMRGYVAAGCVFDLGENEDHVRCVAAPVRDAGNRIVAAISISGAAQHMDAARMATVSVDLRASARAVSEVLGWTADVASRHRSDRRGMST
jgi:DNA-binding IclR family transcriptional regulator